MLLVDALFINGGGGEILLNHLIERLEETNLQITYIIDDRIKNKYQNQSKNGSYIFMAPDFMERRNFYKNNKNTFRNVLCFSNIPPNVKINSKVYTYLHQSLYLEFPIELTSKQKLFFSLKRLILRTLKNNTDYWVVQSNSIKNKLSAKYTIEPGKIKILPFYPEIKINPEIKKIKNQFLYVSNASSYKNHRRLIEGFCDFYDQFQLGELILTVSDDYHMIYNLIKQKSEKYPIKNLGFLKREDLSTIYSSSEYIIFPSLAESFGLGIVEGVECNCKILGSDMPYLYQVCSPSLVFNPNQKDEISNAFYKATHLDLPKSELIIENEIEEILRLLSE